MGKQTFALCAVTIISYLRMTMTINYVFGWSVIGFPASGAISGRKRTGILINIYTARRKGINVISPGVRTVPQRFRFRMRRKLKEIKEKEKRLFGIFSSRSKSSATQPRLDDLSTLQENFILQTCLVRELGGIEVWSGIEEN